MFFNKVLIIEIIEEMKSLHIESNLEGANFRDEVGRKKLKILYN